jgi:chromosome segregation ATPase
MAEIEVTELAVLTERVKNQTETLQRIEKKLDSAQDDHEQRLRDLEKTRTDLISRLGDAERTLSDHEARQRSVEASDRRWAAFAIVASAVLSVVGRLVFP